MGHTRLAIGDSSSGSGRGCWTAYCGSSAKTCWPEAKLALEEAFIDVSFAEPKGAIALVQHAVANGARSRRGRYGLPIAVRVTSSSPNESTLVEDTLGGLPKRLIADRAYDSDRVDERLRQKHSLELICAQSRQAKANSGGRPLRRYAGVGEWSGCYAWLKNYRGICSRWERQAANFLGMIQFGCTLILLRHL